MLINEAFKVLKLAKDGNALSTACFNTWATKVRMPTYPDPEYDAVKTYEEFFSLAYYYIFGD